MSGIDMIAETLAIYPDGFGLLILKFRPQTNYTVKKYRLSNDDAMHLCRWLNEHGFGLYAGA